MSKEEYGTPFSATAAISAGSAVASMAAVAGRTYYITDIAGSSDKAGALLIVKQGTTVIWEVQLGITAAGIDTFSEQFKMPLPGAVGALVSVTVDGTSVCFANIAGFYLTVNT